MVENEEDDEEENGADNFTRSEHEKNSILWERTEIKVEPGPTTFLTVDSVASIEKHVNVLDPLNSSANLEIVVGKDSRNFEEPTTDLSDKRIEESLDRLSDDEIDWYDCEKCGIKFPLASMLNRHRASHVFGNTGRRLKKTMRTKLKKTKDFYGDSNEEKNYSEIVELDEATSPRTARSSLHICNFCDFGCEERPTLTSHLASEHGIVILPEVTTANVKYEICNAENLQNIYSPVNIVNNEKLFICETCNFSCAKRSTLTSHVSRKHRTETIPVENESIKLEYNCDELNFTSDDGGERQEHEKEENKKEKVPINTIFSCNSCSFESANKRTLSSHKRRHHSIKALSEMFICHECDFRTEKKSSLYSHIKRKHKIIKSIADDKPELFSCNQCDYKNKNKYELKVHVARKHTDDFKFTCETCQKKFKVKGDLTNHVRFTHREQPVICDVCGKTCLNSNSLYVHQKFAHYKAKYECKLCKRRMVSQENLDEHMLRQHEKRESVVCEECGKTFSRNSRLKIHMRIHTGDRPYDCKICNKSFARRTALKQHLLIHTGMRPYVCDVCGKAFTQKPGLISHRKCHPGPLPPLPRVRIDHILTDVLKPKSRRCDSANLVHEKQAPRMHRTRHQAKLAAEKERIMLRRNVKNEHEDDEESFGVDENDTMLPFCEIKIESNEQEACQLDEVDELLYLIEGKEDDKSHGDYPCRTCNIQFTTLNMLKKHTKSMHDAIECFECRLCSKVYNTSSSFESDVVAEHGAGIDCTNDCSQKLTLYRASRGGTSCEGENNDAETSPVVKNRETEAHRFSCSQCDYISKNKRSLATHVAKHDVNRKLTCKACKKNFKLQRDLSYHIRFSHREVNHICRICGKTYRTEKMLLTHRQSEHFPGKCECKVCHRLLANEKNLDSHIAACHDNKKSAKKVKKWKLSICDHCGKEFKSDNLKTHMRVHTGEKPYVCVVCKSSFAKKNGLKQHLLLHTGIKPYVCDICDKAFSQKPGLTAHRRSHPGIHPALPPVYIDTILDDALDECEQ